MSKASDKQRHKNIDEINNLIIFFINNNFNNYAINELL